MAVTWLETGGPEWHTMEQAERAAGRVLVVARWSELYETNRSRRLVGAMPWVPAYTNFGSLRYRRLAAQAGGLEAWGVWNVLLRVAALCRGRYGANNGALLMDDDQPHTPQTLAELSGFEAEAIRAGVGVLLGVGWVADVPLGQVLAGRKRFLDTLAARRGAQPRTAPASAAAVDAAPTAHESQATEWQEDADCWVDFEDGDGAQPRTDGAQCQPTDRQTDRQTVTPPLPPASGGNGAQLRTTRAERKAAERAREAAERAAREQRDRLRRAAEHREEAAEEARCNVVRAALDALPAERLAEIRAYLHTQSLSGHSVQADKPPRQWNRWAVYTARKLIDVNPWAADAAADAAAVTLGEWA